MKQLQSIFNEHKAMLISALTEEVKQRGGIIRNITIPVGGRNSTGFERKTLINRISVYHSLFDEDETLFVDAKEKSSKEFIQKPITDFSLDIIETICWAVDETEGGRS